VIAERLKPTEFPRSASYDPEWALENLMGPNVLWLAESLSEVMDLQPGMRVLDLGCGKAVSSIFLAKEFGVQVWSTDLWIDASENWQRVCASGVEELVFPIHAEAPRLAVRSGLRCARQPRCLPLLRYR
jgi:cyclopropane fatty-acyl-phospholipid synthase-like methyltransferase